ncbi:hypothetical protein GUJ93_ZPchr0008g14154 [Zizania palustris]|uniref:Uncharacterized protein n=1 Tax=Zizania palustris TaxID=103762 RepID=A0A8J5RIF6_ZIZPA|nr:hypothetical protein GUJ93_ZPchr0008g14154 [Zizania palustris]
MPMHHLHLHSAHSPLWHFLACLHTGVRWIPHHCAEGELTWWTGAVSSGQQWLAAALSFTSYRAAQVMLPARQAVTCSALSALLSFRDKAAGRLVGRVQCPLPESSAHDYFKLLLYAPGTVHFFVRHLLDVQQASSHRWLSNSPCSSGFKTLK